ncbi:MAG: hypothetical protein F9K23_15890 [Bacteroidetes bacterium]|nr:MAG: hypothetical protein F9K23_15890 [Bacteroidota bacterium]
MRNERPIQNIIAGRLPAGYKIPQNQQPAQPEGLTRIDIGTAFKNVAAYLKHVNARYDSPKKKIRGGVLATFLRVVDAYIRRNPYLQLLHDAPIPVRLNNYMLAAQLNCSNRTIINHLSKLERYGLLYKTFRGTNADYEITVDPRPLLNTITGGKILRVLAGGAPPRHPFGEKNFLHICTSMIPLVIRNIEGKQSEHNIQQSILSGVVVSEAHTNPLPPQSLNTLATFSCNQPEATATPVEKQEESTSEKEKKEGRRGAKSTIPTWQKALVLDFFKQLMKMLYPYRTYSDDMKREILNKIYFHVYAGFKADWPRERWEKYQVELFERIRLAKVWMERPLSPDKAHLYPEGKFLVNPLTYLDARTPYGFIATMDWLAITRKRKELMKCEIEVEKAMKEVLHSGGAINIYRKWQTKFKNKRLPEAIQMYEEAMSTLLQQIANQRNKDVN